MLREIWNRDSLCVTKMTLSINKPREGEDAMITKDSAISRSKLSHPVPVFRTIAKCSMDTLEYGAGAISGIAGESMPVLPAFHDGVRAITAPARAYNKLINSTLPER
jgi:hypothetical protein